MSRTACRPKGFLEWRVMAFSSALTGDLESAPVLTSSRDDGCFYEFEWHTAAACVLSRTEGDNCTVFDSQAGVCHLAPLRFLC